MKRLISIISIVMILTTSANAGFWSSALGTAVGGGGSKNYYGKDASKEPKKVQQTLSKLGFYSGKFDGNLNSFDARSAIEEFQSYYNLKDSGILNKTQKQDLLYMHDLIKNYKIELQNPKDKDSKRLKKLYKAFDKLERKLSNNKFSKQYMSIKFKEDIKNRKVFLKILLSQKNKKELQHKLNFKDNDDGTITDIKRNLMWKKCAEGQKLNGKTCSGEAKKLKWKESKSYAETIKFANYDNWRLPTIKELNTLVYCSNGYKVKYNENGWYAKDDCDHGGKNNYQKPTIYQNLFPNSKGWFWSSFYYNSYNVFIVDFYFGRDKGVNPFSKNKIRLVRNIK
jgi:peptidoglycan hydrolase-like protein with peptidoglycan-binding domain